MTALYVVGFMLDRTRELVVLIEKQRPAWQAGKLNGVGGKVEPGEAVQVAMSREFGEETGLHTPPDWWEPMCGIEWPEDDRVDGTRARVDFLRYWYAGTLWNRIQTKTDEQVHVLPVRGLAAAPVIPNLRWLIPLACYTADQYEPFTLRATVMEEAGA